MSGQPQCFVKLNNTVSQPTGWSTCGTTNNTHPFSSCCENNDYCLSNGICQYTHSESGGSGFYVAGCTDQSYGAANCPQLCNDQPVKDATFQQTPSQVWKCCGANPDGSPSCDKPTNENFNAPKPERLETTWQASVGTVTAQSNGRGGGGPNQQTTSTSSPNAFPPPSGTPSPPPAETTVTVASSSMTAAADPSSQNSHELSSAAAGGIGAGTAAAVLILSALLFLLYRRKKQRQHHSPLAQSPSDNGFGQRNSNQPPVENLQRYDSMGNRSHPNHISSWTPGGSMPNLFDQKEIPSRPRPPTELYGDHAIEMSSDGMITPVPTRMLGHEMSMDSIRPATGNKKGKATWS